MDHKCGVVGIRTRSDEASLLAYYGLYALQHRGQAGAGIVSHDGFQQHSKKGLGLVGEVFRGEDFDLLQGNTAIGHVRYPTYGSISKQSVHPFTVNTKRGSLAFAHNGNLINTDQLRKKLEEDGHAFTTDSDSEVMVHELARNLLDRELIQSLKKTMEVVRGAFSSTLLYNEKVIGVRDPHGIRPLCLGKLKDGFVIASESVVIDVLGGTFIRDLNPGEIVIIDDDGFDSYQIFEQSPAHCFFEYVYFARPDSTIEGRSVYKFRRELGKLLYKYHGRSTDVVSPVPDSGRAFASGYAHAGNMELVESLMKNRYIGRTFIMPTQKSRERAVRLKLNPIKSNVQDKSITIIDDSIVRGTTSKQLVDMLKERGAQEVHMRIGSPPIVSPCHLGIDMASEQELLASGVALDEVRETIGADSLEYATVDEISNALNIPLKNLCTGCVGGQYPV